MPDTQYTTITGKPSIDRDSAMRQEPRADQRRVVEILAWRPLQKNTLLGFAKVQLPSGMIISDVCVMHAERGLWATPPSKPMIDASGAVLRDRHDKVRYAPIIEFATSELRALFSRAVIAALRAAHPGALP